MTRRRRRDSTDSSLTTRERAEIGAREGLELGALYALAPLLALPFYWEGAVSLLVLVVVCAMSIVGTAGMGAILAVGRGRLGGRRWLLNGLSGVPLGLTLALLGMLLDPQWRNGWFLLLGLGAGFIAGALEAYRVRPWVADGLSQGRTRRRNREAR